MTKNRTSPSAIKAAYKQAKALELRLEGLTLYAIAKQLGYANPSGAWHAIRAGLQNSLRLVADEYREIEELRLDALWLKLWERLHAPGPLPVAQLATLVGRLLDVSNRRSELLGLDAPTKIAPIDPSGFHEWVGLTDSEMVAEFLAILERAGQAPDANDDDDPGGRAIGQTTWDLNQEGLGARNIDSQIRFDLEGAPSLVRRPPSPNRVAKMI